MKPWSGPAFAVVAKGITVTSAVKGKLLQRLAVAVMVKVDVWGTAVTLVRAPVIGVPLPLAAIPVRLVVLFLIQLNVVPPTPLGFVITIGVMATPEHTV